MRIVINKSSVFGVGSRFSSKSNSQICWLDIWCLKMAALLHQRLCRCFSAGRHQDGSSHCFSLLPSCYSQSPSYSCKSFTLASVFVGPKSGW